MTIERATPGGLTIRDTADYQSALLLGQGPDAPPTRQQGSPTLPDALWTKDGWPCWPTFLGWTWLLLCCANGK